jgi:heme/copper-type cytochrome/quinol oxidase subunit 4
MSSEETYKRCIVGLVLLNVIGMNVGGETLYTLIMVGAVVSGAMVVLEHMQRGRSVADAVGFVLVVSVLVAAVVYTPIWSFVNAYKDVFGSPSSTP